MKIYTVTGDFFSSVESLFGVEDVDILPAKPQGVSADLVVFTGGEDIDPFHYRAARKLDPRRYNLERDTRELQVISSIISGEIKTKKVLGICRGMQLLNVAMKGTLIQDIPTRFGKSHDYYHPLSHLYSNMFDFLTMTNSMHHQALDKYGSYAGRFPTRIIAVEPATKTAEIIMWGSKYLGVQFHPEFFNDENPAKAKFVSCIKEWVKGAHIIPSVSAKEEVAEIYLKAVSEDSYPVDTSTFTFVTSPGTFAQEESAVASMYSPSDFSESDDDDNEE